MQRIIKFTNYRNLGKEEKNRTLVLNRTMEKGKMGDLIILIGPNNSGKSNVLDGIISINQKLTKRDITELSFLEDDRKPEISLMLRDPNTKKTIMSITSNINEVKPFTAEHLVVPNEDLLKFKTDAVSICSKYNLTDYDLTKQLNKIESDPISDILYDNIQSFVIQLKKKSNSFSICRHIYEELKEANNKLMTSLEEISVNYLNDISKENFGTVFFNKAIKYIENPLNKNDLKVDINNLQNSTFFKSVFKYIGIEYNEIINAYNQYEQFANPASLNKIKNKINSKMEIVNNRFNELYFTNNDKYLFTIELSPNNTISFGMARGKNEDPIILEYQSAGFRWFFNLFFNFLCSDELNAGDIIVMDEPATNLHPQGQIELRKFIKSFAKQNDLTFVIATHMPFLIDIDNYNELRVVSSIDNWTEIYNDFYAINIEDPDSLKPIKESLTIKQNVLYDIDTEVVWVEGITDYNYLTMFKKLLNEKNIAFLPFNGVGTDDNQQLQIIKKLCTVKFFKVGVLVDGDKAGQKMIKNLQGTMLSRAHMISELSKNNKIFTVMEDLFSKNDLKKFDLSSKDKLKKSSNKSAVMKETCKLEDFEQESIDNFKTLFKLLQE